MQCPRTQYWMIYFARSVLQCYLNHVHARAAPSWCVLSFYVPSAPSCDQRALQCCPRHLSTTRGEKKGEKKEEKISFLVDNSTHRVRWDCTGHATQHTVRNRWYVSAPPIARDEAVALAQHWAVCACTAAHTTSHTGVLLFDARRAYWVSLVVHVVHVKRIKWFSFCLCHCSEQLRSTFEREAPSVRIL